MKLDYKYIHFRWSDGMDGYICRNTKSNDYLGLVLWYSTWKRFVFQADENAVFSSDCLRDIAAFEDEATKEKKKEGV